ncbi:MAG: ECF transporter S component [Chloroflexia bacterium]|nr:ECF transporter S component [Chloroflexia bacterium]
MKPKVRRLLGIAVLTLLYPAMAPIVTHIPNPMVPGAYVALNMIVPVLAGFFYGPVSGALTGALGTALSALILADPFDCAAVFPHLVMGAVAGWTGRYRSELLSATTIVLGHGLNMLFFLRLQLLTIAPQEIGSTLLGLTSETMIDIVAIVLACVLLKRWLYHVERW